MSLQLEQQAENPLNQKDVSSLTIEPIQIDAGTLSRDHLRRVALRLLTGKGTLSTSLSSPTPPALLDHSLSDMLANRGGFERSIPSNYEIELAIQYLEGLIAAHSGFGSHFSITSYLIRDQVQYLGGGEGYVAIAKMRGCKVRLIDCPDHELRLIKSMSDIQVVFDRAGRLIHRSFTSSIADVAGNYDYTLTSSISFETIKDLFRVIAGSRNRGKSNEDPKHAVIELETASGNVILSIVLLSSPLGSINKRNEIIHTRRRDLLAHSIKRIETHRQYFRGKKLDKISHDKIREVFDLLLGPGAGAVGNAPLMKAVLEILDRIPEFNCLLFSDKVAIYSEFINTVWLGTGNIHEPNPPGYGLNARVADQRVIADKIGLVSI